jgi:glycosyltransferase involved in cell wall biosynthesis
VPIPWSPKVLWFKKKWRRYGELPDKINMDGLEVFYLKYFFLKPAKIFFKLNAKLLYHAAFRFIMSNFSNKTYDLILARPLIPTGYSACLLSKRMNLPVVCEGTGSDVKIYPYYNGIAKKMYTEVLNNADKIIANAKNLSEEINAFVSRKLCDVVYRGVDIQKFKPFNKKIETRKFLKMDPNCKAVLFVGNLSKAKGIYDLFSAFKITSKKFSNTKLYLIGPTSPDVDIKKLKIDKELIGRVNYLGQKPHAEMPLWYNACDLFVLPSYTEGMPNVVLEAMACARPVVVTPVGGIPEVIENGVSGLLVEPGNIDGLAKAMLKVLTEDGLAKAMGANARELITQSYVDIKNAEKLKELLTYLLREKRRYP